MTVGIPAQEQRQEKPMNDVVAPVWNGIDFKAEAHRDPWSVPLDEIDVSNPYLYSEDTWHGFFAPGRSSNFEELVGIYVECQ
jgi:hypothetical protein